MSDATQPLLMANPTRVRKRRMTPEQLAEQKHAINRYEELQDWLSGTTDGLKNAWVSLCRNSQTNNVTNERLSAVIEAIQTGDLNLFDGSNYSIEAVASRINRLFKKGVDDAEDRNRNCLNLAMKRLPV